MQSSYSIEFHIFSDSSDTSCSIYTRAAFMTVLAVHPEAINQDSYYRDCVYLPVDYGMCVYRIYRYKSRAYMNAWQNWAICYSYIPLRVGYHC